MPSANSRMEIALPSGLMPKAPCRSSLSNVALRVRSLPHRFLNWAANQPVLLNDGSVHFWQASGLALSLLGFLGQPLMVSRQIPQAQASVRFCQGLMRRALRSQQGQRELQIRDCFLRPPRPDENLAACLAETRVVGELGERGLDDRQRQIGRAAGSERV